VFGLGAATRVYLAVGQTDMRKGFNGLFGLVRDRLQCEPLSGHVFLFCNGQRNRLKLVFWDGSGLWVCAKRLEKGKFRWPEINGDQNKVQLSQEELALLWAESICDRRNDGSGTGGKFLRNLRHNVVTEILWSGARI